MASEIPAFVTLQLLLRGYLKSNSQVLYLILRAFAVINFEMEDIPNKSALQRVVLLYRTLYFGLNCPKRNFHIFD